MHDFFVIFNVPFVYLVMIFLHFYIILYIKKHWKSPVEEQTKKKIYQHFNSIFKKRGII